MIRAPSSSSRPAKRNAFIVDDEQRMRALIAKVVISVGFTPHEFSHVPELEAALTRVRPEVIVLDCSLGGSDAIEVMRSLAASQFRGKVLLVSGHDPTTLGEVQSIGERHGLAMLPFLRKPFGIAELKARLTEEFEIASTPTDEVDLRAGLENKWLELWYQPKIDLKSMLTCGAEALIRLRHPDRGIVPPSAFLPPAGDPLYGPLTDFVVRRSLSDWPMFNAAGIPIRLAINVPASVLQMPDFVRTVRDHLPRGPGFPGLVVEITEDEALCDPELAREVAIQLKLYGIAVSIDDFGTGFSSFSRLAELPFAELKLDRRFVDGCSDDEGNRSMCQNVVDLAHRFGITAVAEGVENATDLKALVDMGYDVAQGFFFAKPMEIGAFVDTARLRGAGMDQGPIP